jgi:hypothetical protein
MAFGATLLAEKVVLCGSGFQPRQNRGKMPLPQNKETNLLGKKKEAGRHAGRRDD